MCRIVHSYMRAVYTGDQYALLEHTARTYGRYVWVSKMRPYIRTVNTGRIYGSYLRVARVGL